MNGPVAGGSAGQVCPLLNSTADSVGDPCLALAKILFPEEFSWCRLEDPDFELALPPSSLAARADADLLRGGGAKTHLAEQ